MEIIQIKYHMNNKINKTILIYQINQIIQILIVIRYWKNQ